MNNTPQQEADSLVDLFYNTLMEVGCHVPAADSDTGYEYTRVAAKVVAETHVQGIIDLLEGWPVPRDTTIEVEITKHKKVLLILQSK